MGGEKREREEGKGGDWERGDVDGEEGGKRVEETGDREKRGLD